jgi:hypothetical protein
LAAFDAPTTSTQSYQARHELNKKQMKAGERDEETYGSARARGEELAVEEPGGEVTTAE